MYERVLQNALRAAIFEEMAAAPARCPRCGNAHVVSKGRDRDGGRRWLCRGCGRTFSAKTSGVLALSKLKACVLTGVSDLGDCFCRLVGRGKAGKAQVEAGIAGVPLAGAVVSADQLVSYVAPVHEAGGLAHDWHDSKEAGEDELGMADALHSRLKSFLDRLDGVPARRLPRHLAWFCRAGQARHSDAARLGMLAPQVAHAATELCVRAMWDEPQPFFDECWGGKVWADEVDLDDLYEPEFVSTVV